MLETLLQTIHEVNRARDLDEVLSITTRQVKQAITDADVVSVYLTDFDHKQNVLMLAEGLQVANLDDVRMELGEGLVGLISRRAEPVNLADGQQHPQYKYFPQLGTENLHGFLGVPIIHQRNVLGVLVIQGEQKKSFSDDTVAFLTTLAAQLAGAIAHAEARGQGLSVQRIRSHERDLFIQAVPGAPGVGVGQVMVLYSNAILASVPDRLVIDIDDEVLRYQDALAKVLKGIDDMKVRLGDDLEEENRLLFDAYSLLVNSDTIVEGVIEKIREGSWAPGALRDIIQSSSQRFEEMEDLYLRERATDIREIGQMILRQLMENESGERTYQKHTILVGENVGATDLAEAPLKNIAAVVSTKGSSSSHVAILARALGIPAVMGADDLDLSRVDGHELIVDGYTGRLFVDPSSATRTEYSRLAEEEHLLTKELRSLRKLPAETPDGRRIPLYVNTGLTADITPSKKSGAEGVGLYRTEFPFMIRDRFPGEEEQRKIYHQTLKAFAPRPVTLRTLDVGGDKALPYFPIQEENPFLGWRGIRITLDHREIFLTQVRAMIRAAIGLDNLNILLPMISDLGELDEAMLLIDQVFAELQEEEQEVSWPRVGAMIEVPSSVYQAEELAQRVDFLSIGTNDLTQYILAVDRNNSRVAKLYDTLHPAVLRAINQVVDAGHKYGRPVGVCGEMAGDPAAAILLLGMGVDNLSMTVAGLPRIKWVIRSFSYRDARIMLTKALQMDSAHEIRKYLVAALDSAGLGGLIRAGKH